MPIGEEWNVYVIHPRTREYRMVQNGRSEEKARQVTRAIVEAFGLVKGSGMVMITRGKDQIADTCYKVAKGEMEMIGAPEWWTKEKR